VTNSTKPTRTIASKPKQTSGKTFARRINGKMYTSAKAWGAEMQRLRKKK